MPSLTVTMKRVVTCWSGEMEKTGGCSYNHSAVYDDLDEALADVKAALLGGRQVLMEPGLMTAEDYGPPEAGFAEGVNPLIDKQGLVRT